MNGLIEEYFGSISSGQPTMGQLLILAGCGLFVFSVLLSIIFALFKVKYKPEKARSAKTEPAQKNGSRTGVNEQASVIVPKKAEPVQAGKGTVVLPKREEPVQTGKGTVVLPRREEPVQTGKGTVVLPRREGPAQTDKGTVILPKKEEPMRTEKGTVILPKRESGDSAGR